MYLGTWKFLRGSQLGLRSTFVLFFYLMEPYIFDLSNGIIFENLSRQLLYETFSSLIWNFPGKQIFFKNTINLLLGCDKMITKLKI